MSVETARAVIKLLEHSSCVDIVDLTGGAPELNPSFPHLVERARALGHTVIDRCNLTVLLERSMRWLPDFLANNCVRLVCSLPCYTAANVDKQRGLGVFDASIKALRQLNSIGYGMPGSPLILDLVYNPLGADLPPPQAELADRFHHELRKLFGIEFNDLLTITNMPIKRFADQLHRLGNFDGYMSLLVNHFNAATVSGLMCRDLVSVGWEGSLYDCDFNQMLEIPLLLDGEPARLETIESLDALEGTPISTDRHCFGCTAGAGSGCSGTIAQNANQQLL